MKFFKNQSDFLFYLFMGLHLLVWSLLPLLRGNAPLDSIEAVLWGYNGGWGFDKHPPLSGWLADWMYQLIPSDFSIYLLSQVCVASAFFFVWKLSDFYLKEGWKKFLAVFLLEGCLVYTILSPEFNVNILLLGIFPAAIYFFHEAVFKESFVSSLIFAILCASAFLTKYSAVIMLATFGIYMLFTRKGQSFLLSWRGFLALVGGIVLILPHILWMIDTDGMTLTYGMMRSTKEAYSIWHHFTYPIAFIMAQVGLVFGSLMMFLALKPRLKKPKLTDELRFLDFMLWTPVVLLVLPSLFFGLEMQSMWGVPFFGLLPLWLLTRFDVQISKSFKVISSGLIFLTLLGFIGTIFFHLSYRVHFPGVDFSQTMYEQWRSKTQEDLVYVGGDMWLAGNVAFYHPDGTRRPKVFIEMNPTKNPNLKIEDFETKGGLIFANSLPELMSYGILENKAEKMEIVLKNQLGKMKKRMIYYFYKKGQTL